MVIGLAPCRMQAPSNSGLHTMIRVGARKRTNQHGSRRHSLRFYTAEDREVEILPMTFHRRESRLLNPSQLIGQGCNVTLMFLAAEPQLLAHLGLDIREIPFPAALEPVLILNRASHERLVLWL